MQDVLVVEGMSLLSSANSRDRRNVSGRCRFCRDQSMLHMCSRCGGYQCEDCIGTNTLGIYGVGTSCSECLEIAYTQKRREEEARNQIAKSLVPLPTFMLANKKDADSCAVCDKAFSIVRFAFKHNCKACGEVVCSNGSCVRRRQMSDGACHKVCRPCSGADLPQHAVKDAEHPRFYVTSVIIPETSTSTERMSTGSNSTLASTSSDSAVCSYEPLQQQPLRV